MKFDVKNCVKETKNLLDRLVDMCYEDKSLAIIALLILLDGGLLTAEKDYIHTAKRYKNICPDFVHILINGKFSKESIEVAKDDILAEVDNSFYNVGE